MKEKPKNTPKPAGIPKRDGSGQGVRANINRGGCAKPKPKGRGR